MQPALNRELDCRRKCIACRRKNELQRTAAECRPVYSLTGCSKHHLFDEIAEVILVTGRSGSTAGIKSIWVVDVHLGFHMPLTRVWTVLISNGVPVGRQVAWLSISRTGAPSETTRVAKLRNCAVTQGPFPAGGGGKVQPATE